MNKRKFWTSDKIISLSAFLISLATLFTLMFQTRLMQKQQYASALPYLMIYNQVPDNKSYSLLVKNTGVGPAFIQEIKVYYRGKSYDVDPNSFLRQVVDPKNPVDFYYASVVKGRVISAGEEIEMVGVRNSVKDAGVIGETFNVDSNKGDAEVEIVYTSIYNEVWRVRGFGGIPEKLD